MNHLDPIALFTLGDFKNDIANLLTSFPSIYMCVQSSAGVYVTHLDKATNLVVDDKQGMSVKLDVFKASVKPSRDGGVLEIRFNDVALRVHGASDKASVEVPEGRGLVYREGQKVVMVFGAHAPIEAGMTTVLKKAISKVVKWRKGELTFKPN